MTQTKQRPQRWICDNCEKSFTDGRVRSIEQNRRHWARMEQFAYWINKKQNKHTDKNHWHYYFAGEAFGWVEVGTDGRAVPAQTRWRSPYQYSEMEALIDEKADDWGVTLMEREEWQEYKRAAGV